MNFSEIKTRLENILNRGDLTAVLGDYINDAVRHIERLYNFHYMFTTSTAITTSAGTDEYTLPSDLKAIKYFYLTVSGSKHFLTGCDIEDLERLNTATSPSNSIPQRFAVSGISDANLLTVKLDPPPDDAYSSELGYYAFSGDLAASTDENWLTRNAPEVVLYRACIEMEPFLRNDNRLMVWKALYEEKLTTLKSVFNIRAVSSQGEEIAFYGV